MRYGSVSICSRVVFRYCVYFSKTSIISGCSDFSTRSVFFISSWKQGKRSEGQAPWFSSFFMFHRTNFQNFIAPSLVPSGRYFMASSITSQSTRSKCLLDIRTLVVKKRLACVFTLYFLVTFERKADILRGPTMQCQPSLGKLLMVLQLLLTEKNRIFATASHFKLASSMEVSWS